MARKTEQRTADAVEILRRRYVAGNPKAEAMLEEIRAEAELARSLFRLRTEAGLTQQALARQIGTTASVISRLEDADYSGHSVAMLRRIAAALGRRVEIRFPAARGKVPSPVSRARRGIASRAEQQDRKSEESAATRETTVGKAGQRSTAKPGSSSK